MVIVPKPGYLLLRMSPRPPRFDCWLGFGLVLALDLGSPVLAAPREQAPPTLPATTPAPAAAGVTTPQPRSPGQRPTPEANTTERRANPAREPVRTEPTVELVTVGPGPMLFHRYGHAALCLGYRWPHRRSRCFNHGSSHFQSPPQTRCARCE